MGFKEESQVSDFDWLFFLSQLNEMILNFDFRINQEFDNFQSCLNFYVFIGRN